MTEAEPVVLINVFKCAPANQAALMEHLTAMARIQSGLDGFVSQTVHRGLNGKVVVNHAVWASAEAWKAMSRHPAVAAAMDPIMTIATFEPHLYEPGTVITPT
jgi:heme-degrading monooxygenase HmoA|tara:strand:+ start:1194 stop:1502 length:309 start_codon:yes stop_codon:yes gene_type:complete